MRLLKNFLLLLFSAFLLQSCIKRKAKDFEWARHPDNPVFRDLVEEDAYQVASDPHVFFDDQENLWMIYSGDIEDRSSIKLAKGSSYDSWEEHSVLLTGEETANGDHEKETAFYFHNPLNNKHQIYYIGYEDGDTYQAQVYLAESDAFNGPYEALDNPVVERGSIAGQSVYCITSPSVVEHDSVLYMVFLGWNASPAEVAEVYIIGAKSYDMGHTWEEFEEVETPVAMEGQLTKTPEGKYIAVGTQAYKKREGIYYAVSDHPFGPYVMEEDPIIVQNKGKLERNEVIAPQIVIDPNTDQEYLYYTGAWHLRGWWVMLAEKP